MSTLFSPAIEKAATELDLTIWGKVRLTILCDSAIEEGLKATKNYKDAKDPFKYFMSQAMNYSNKNGIKLRWDRCFDLQQQLGMPADCTDYVNLKVEKKSTPKGYYKVPIEHDPEEFDSDKMCQEWHEMVMNWDNLSPDPKNYALPRRQRRCIKGQELNISFYKDWLLKQDISVRQALADKLPAYRVLMDLPFKMVDMVETLTTKFNMNHSVVVPKMIEPIDDPNIEYVDMEYDENEARLLFDGETDPS